MSTTPRRRIGAPESGGKPGEFQRVFWLLGLVALIGGGIFVYQYSALKKAQRREVEQAHREASALVPKEKLTPEQIEARKTALLSKFEGALSDIENDQDLNYNETPGYRKLLELLIRYTPEEVTKRTTLEFDWKAAMADPDAWRGEFVRARGILSEMWAIKLKTPVLGRPDVYRALLGDFDESISEKEEQFQGFFIDLTERPPELRSDSREVLEVEGVFYRTAKYKGRKDEWHTAPVIVVRNLRVLPAAVESGWRAAFQEYGLWIVAGMAVFVISLALLLSAFRKQRRPPRTGSGAGGSFQDMFDQKLREAGKVPPPRD